MRMSSRFFFAGLEKKGKREMHHRCHKNPPIVLQSDSGLMSCGLPAHLYGGLAVGNSNLSRANESKWRSLFPRSSKIPGPLPAPALQSVCECISRGVCGAERFCVSVARLSRGRLAESFNPAFNFSLM